MEVHAALLAPYLGRYDAPDLVYDQGDEEEPEVPPPRRVLRARRARSAPGQGDDEVSSAVEGSPAGGGGA